MLHFVSLSHDTKELALFNVKPLLEFDSASERILAYLRMFVGQEIEDEELWVVSGIFEFARLCRRVSADVQLRHAVLWKSLN